ncbi:hypothetical protein [Streptomyces sp. ML-6]|uniref:hypothetical protein n=1 Tax=Streptomyces sp. ML-6 TaxID=2982693 RepID=UPI0024BF85D1|nr:hypothetical protein [Streptomyces sp. ML-6]MDK0525095.1 hypothetical protein [Streptomyces sp. ML-6]
MPKDHARKKALTAIKDELGVKHADAIALLDHPDADERETLERYLAEYIDINTYGEALAYLRQQQADPRNQLLCEQCGWTNSMVCPECEKGCGCEYGCTGWRHHEYAHDEDDSDSIPYGCDECGAGGSGDPYGECCCYEDEEEQAA